MAKKPMYATMSFMEYEILKIINFMRAKHIKVSRQSILDHLDDDPISVVSGFIRGLLAGKLISFSKKEGFKLFRMVYN